MDLYFNLRLSLPVVWPGFVGVDGLLKEMQGGTDS